MKSDCIKQCKRSPDGTHCVGCKRTIKEIIDAGRKEKLQRTTTRPSKRDETG